MLIPIRTRWRTPLLPLVILVMLAAPLFAQDWYVAPDGDDDNPGTADAPFASINRGVAVAREGHTVWIRGGTYYPGELIEIQASGTAESPITIRSMPGETVIIDGRHSVPGWNWDGVITGWNRSHIVIDGLTIINSRWAGIQFNGGTGLTVRNCSTDRTYASGIYIRDARKVLVTRNRVRRANTFPIFDVERSSQEGITLANVDGFDISHNVVHDRMVDTSNGGEGIDAKGGSRNGTIRHNVVYDLIRLGIYVDAFGSELSDIAIYGNIVYNCRHGISVANEVNRGFTRGIRVHDNLVFNCTNRGITIAGYEQNGPVQDVEIFNNTIVGNGSAGGWEAAGLVIEANNQSNRNFVVSNNLLSGNRTGIVTRGQEYLTIDRNLIHGPVGDVAGTRAILADPLFVDPEQRDYRLRAGSPAIDAALGHPVSTRDLDGRRRPFDGTGDGLAIADLGAFERPALSSDGHAERPRSTQ